MPILVEERRCRCGAAHQHVHYYYEGIGSFQPGTEPVTCADCSAALDRMTLDERKEYFAGYPLEQNPTLASVMGAGRSEVDPNRAKA